MNGDGRQVLYWENFLCAAWSKAQVGCQESQSLCYQGTDLTGLRTAFNLNIFFPRFSVMEVILPRRLSLESAKI